MLDFKDTQIASGPRAEARDEFLLCLQFLARHFERPSSETVLIAGLPLEDGHLTLELVSAAAARIGLAAKTLKRQLNELVPLNLPSILLTQTHGPVVIFDYSVEEGCRIFEPRTGQIAYVSLEAINQDYTGVAVTIVPRFGRADIDPGVPAALHRGHWFFGPLAKHWRSFISVAVAAAIINIVGITTPLFTMNVYDRVLPNTAMATLWVLAIGFGVVLVFDLVLKTARAVLLDTVGKVLDIELSGLIFEKIMNTPLAHRSNSTGEFVNRVTQYEFVREFFTSSTLVLFVDAAFVFVYLLVIYIVAGWLVVIPMAAMIIIVAIGAILQHVVGDEIAKAQTESSLRHAMLVEAVSAIETIKTMRAEGQFLRRWDRLIRVASETQERIKSVTSAAVNTTLFFQQLVTIAVIVAGAYRFADKQITTGAIIAAVMLSSRAVAPLTQVALMLTRARYAVSAMKTLNSVMNLEDERVATESFVTRPVEHGKLEFRKVAFQYPLNSRFVLDGINLSIAPGEKVGIIGKVGSGKTTLGRLVAGFYAPTNGEILIDGVDLRQYHPHEVRKAVGLVMQDTDLFIGSLKANLLIANPDASDADLIRACKLAGVDDFVSLHPLGYDLPVGERGRNLSTGQKQALALARVLLVQPKILFLDEPSSAMDLATERNFLMRLKSVMKPDQTLLITTHRYSMLDLAERLIILDNGRIVADGPKNAVLEALKKQQMPA
ncbi:MAG TPA: type I secretion system permease/ATPase [Methylovirgula sp.]|nr:type I secretion system permease/ATPase [Methylovirgula sp.]